MKNINPKSLKNLKPPFKKGEPAPPNNGRPKGRSTITAALRRLMNAKSSALKLPANMDDLVKELKLKNISDVLALKLVSVGLLSKNPSAAISAIKEVTDRTEGQSAQSINIKNINFEKLNDEQLRVLATGGSLSDAGIIAEEEEESDI